MLRWFQNNNMKLSICLLAILGCSSSLPSPPLAWEDIKGKNVYIDPISNYTVEAPVGGRIIGGTEVERNSRPYQVAVIINGVNFCSGSLISNNYVLSAAHCTIGASYAELIFGAHSVSQQEPTQVRVTSTSIYSHLDYQSYYIRNDISLIKTPSPIVTNANIQIIDLAPSSSGNFAGASAFLSGWGRISDSDTSISSVLQGVTLNVVANAVCEDAYGTIVQPSTICTSGVGTVGGCNGDSGGPLVVGNVQVGVTSFVSSRGCEAGLPTGYARVSHFRAWISHNSDV